MSDTQSSSGDQLFAARNWCACVYVCVCVRVCVCVCVRVTVLLFRARERVGKSTHSFDQSGSSQGA